MTTRRWFSHASRVTQECQRSRCRRSYDMRLSGWIAQSCTLHIVFSARTLSRDHKLLRYGGCQIMLSRLSPTNRSCRVIVWTVYWSCASTQNYVCCLARLLRCVFYHVVSYCTVGFVLRCLESAHSLAFIVEHYCFSEVCCVMNT